MIYGDRVINQNTSASCFTESWTDPANRKREGVPFHDEPERFLILSFCNVSDISLHIYLSGTCQITWGLAVSKMRLGELGEAFFAQLHELFGVGHNNHVMLNNRLA